MDHREAGRYWNENADAWTKLARAGYDVYRDHLNTPAFFAILPPVEGKFGIDIGCGEGHNTRLLAGRGARMTAIDIAEVFIEHAREFEACEPLGIDYRVASAVELPFDDGAFDFATGFMSFMDIPETERVVSEAYRVLRPAGFLQFSVSHPCFDTPHRRNLRNVAGMTYAIEVGDYFRNLRGGRCRVALCVRAGRGQGGSAEVQDAEVHADDQPVAEFADRYGLHRGAAREPRPSDETVRASPDLQDAQVVSYFLHIRVRKPIESLWHVP